MEPQRISSISYAAMVFLSLTALLTVLQGYALHVQPESDEGALAHVFQLAVVAFVPATVVFLSAGDWGRTKRIAQRLAFPASLLFLAFAALYHLEHP